MEAKLKSILLFGQPGVGKTCLVYRYLYNTFGETISVRGATRFSRHSDLRAAAAS